MTEALAIQAAGNVTMSATAAYADFTATLQARHRGLSLLLLGGARAGDLSDDPWGQIRMHYVFAPWVAVEGAAGRYPRDLMGFTDGTFGTLGIRVSLLGSVRGLGVTRPAPSPRPPLRVDALPDGQRRITVRYAHAVRQQLEIAGNWNGWMPVPLERGGRDTWSVVLRLTPGLYQYQLIVDGDTWTIPDGAPWVPDEFGGRVGLMVVKQEVGSGE
ncbi:MAG TPA: glycogen-binding domain-containing protein [Gemmatimonadales bacterium]|nr:glycogen-binding domain-containing protein [Gemmatimonadales bacterium]